MPAPTSSAAPPERAGGFAGAAGVAATAPVTAGRIPEKNRAFRSLRHRAGVRTLPCIREGSSMRRRTVAHLVTQFNIGGTERQLVERLRRHPASFAPIVVCNHAVGEFLEPIRSLGIEPIVVPYAGLLHPSAGLAVARLAAGFKLLHVDVAHANDFGMSVLGVAAVSFAALVAGHRMLSEPTPGTDQQV